MAQDPERLKRSEPEERQSRATQERAQTENREISEEERLELFRGSFYHEALPEIPPIPGFHMFWATTTNPRDTIASRIRLGYELVTAAELGGAWSNLSVKTGAEFAGGIMVNEMLALKLPLSLYNKYMLEAHHFGPAREQEKLTDVVDQIRDEAERRKARLEEEEGTRELRRAVRAPSFAE